MYCLNAGYGSLLALTTQADEARWGKPILSLMAYPVRM
jgi:hypothetical protein